MSQHMDIMKDAYQHHVCPCDFRSKMRAFESEKTLRLLTCEDTATVTAALTASASATRAKGTKRR